VVGGALLAIFTMDPNSQDNFFLALTSYQSKLVVGVVVSFVLGMLWRRATAAGGLAAILAGVLLGITIPMFYDGFLSSNPTLRAAFGEQLNFMHTALVNAVLCTIVHVGVSLCTKCDQDKSRFTWTGLGIFTPSMLKRFFCLLAISIAIYTVCGIAVFQGVLKPAPAGWLAAGWTWLMFVLASRGRLSRAGSRCGWRELLTDDLCHAGALAATAVFMLFYFA
jgi:hypothetical protein